MHDEAAPPAGLRETKKARTRQRISDVATRVFAESGFEHVTVAQIAAAAEVSVKTVFNYFPAKEDLFFDRAEELVRDLEGAVAGRERGLTVTAALHRLCAENRVPFPGEGWAGLRDGERYEAFRRFVATEHASSALRARRLAIAQAWGLRLAPTFAAAFELREDDPRVRTYATMVIAILGLREETLSAAMLERASARTVERRVRAVVDEAFGRLAHAFADVDRPAGATGG